MKNNVLINKRYQISNYKWLIIFVLLFCMFTFGIIKTIYPYDPIIIVLFISSPTMLLAVVLQIKYIIKMTKFPKCKVAEIIDDDFIIYGYKSKKGLYIRHKINIHDIINCKVKREYGGGIGRGKYLVLKHRYLIIYTRPKTTSIIIKDYPKTLVPNKQSNNELVNYPLYKMKKLLNAKLKN